MSNEFAQAFVPSVAGFAFLPFLFLPFLLFAPASGLAGVVVAVVAADGASSVVGAVPCWVSIAACGCDARLDGSVQLRGGVRLKDARFVRPVGLL